MTEKNFEKGLFIFRRDLRLNDNLGLIFALESAVKVIPCFIFTPEQVEANPYKSNRCLQFMIESLEDLNEQLETRGSKLYLFEGAPEEIISKCVKELNIDAVIINRDYTPYSIARDKKMEQICKKQGVFFQSFDDALLNPPEVTVKKDGSPYTIFTPFYKNALKEEIAKPITNAYSNYSNESIPFSKNTSLYKKILPKREPQAPGGRTACLKILRGIKKYSDYSATRDFPALDHTTHLSAHLKFTTCSPREVYYAIDQHVRSGSDLLRSLYWRDFFSSIAFFYPHIFKGPFQKKFAHLKWIHNKSHFEKWCTGQTGFPIVDAGMREMNETGFMHNRVRMIVASFLVKDLHIDWRWGEKYFAQTLIDYDPAVNNGNWQWCASTGCDAQPYFRIFNPWNQQKKFDPDCKYIKKWVPELSNESSKTIHNLLCEEIEGDYPPPMVDHTEEARKAITSYKKQ